jgi:tetratricopeptide (TPR) repeat protein
MMEPSYEAWTLRRRAQAALEVGRPERAAADATRAIGLDPGAAQGHTLLGWALLGLDKPREALEAVDGGLAHCAEDAYLHRLRSVILFELKRFDEALAAAESAIALAPDLSYAHSSRAFALSALGRQEEALEAAATAVSLDPEEVDHHTKLAEERMSLDPVLAERHARAALALSPEDVAALTLLGGALVRQKRGDEACEVWEEAVRLDPTAETPKAALVHHLNAELSMGALRRFILRTLEWGRTQIPGEEAGLGKKILAIVPMLGLIGATKGLIHLSELATPLRMERLKRRAPKLHALYTQLKEDGQPK